jgi:hypothetical protein
MRISKFAGVRIEHTFGEGQAHATVKFLYFRLISITSSANTLFHFIYKRRVVYAS